MKLNLRSLRLAAAFAVSAWFTPDGIAALQAPGAHTAQAVDATASQTQARRFGPYATIRRANEVAFEFRQQGYRTNVFHNGDGYYVDVW